MYMPVLRPVVRLLPVLLFSHPQVWREYPDGGTVNFLPGMGGFLQSIIYGYGGVRIRPEMLEFHNPMPPDGLEGLRFHGFHYLGANMTITIYSSPSRKVDIEVSMLEPPYYLNYSIIWPQSPLSQVHLRLLL